MLLEVKANNTNNYNNYNKKYQDTKSFVDSKTKVINWALKQKEFKLLKTELDKYKRSL